MAQFTVASSLLPLSSRKHPQLRARGSYNQEPKITQGPQNSKTHEDFVVKNIRVYDCYIFLVLLYFSFQRTTNQSLRFSSLLTAHSAMLSG